MPAFPSRLRIACVPLLMLAAQSFLFGGDAWKNLDNIPHDVYYTVVFRDGTCAEGRIQKVLGDSLTLSDSSKGTKVARSDVVQAKDVLQVKDGRNPFDILYSGRSSWSDVQSIPANTREHPIITLKSGKSISGRMVDSTDSEVSVKPSEGVETIAKQEIASVAYYRIKPAPGSAANRPYELPAELFYLLFNPAGWPYLFKTANMTVPLYDSALPEDNSTVQCSRLR